MCAYTYVPGIPSMAVSNSFTSNSPKVVSFIVLTDTGLSEIIKYNKRFDNVLYLFASNFLSKLFYGLHTLAITGYSYLLCIDNYLY